MRNAALLPLLLAVSCYSYEDYLEEQATATCELYEDCELLSYLGCDDIDCCKSSMLEDPYECEDFSSDAADECLAGVSSLDCESFLAGSYPTSCAEVCSSLSAAAE